MPDPVLVAESTAVSTAVSTTAQARWFDGFDDGVKNYITQRGLAEKDPAAAFLEAAKAHQEAQAYIGVPKEQLLKLPKADAAPEEWDAVYERLGYSKDPAAYALDGLKNPDGSEVPAGLLDHVRAQAQALKLSPAAAKTLAEQTIAYNANANQSQSAETTAAAARAMEQLRNSWGANYDANRVIADRAYAAIMAAAGFDQGTMTKAIQTLGETAGRAETMQLLLAVGQRISEDSFTGGGHGGGGPNSMIATVEQAKARIDELKADTEFSKRYLAGGVAEMREMADLHLRAYPPE